VELYLCSPSKPWAGCFRVTFTFTFYYPWFHVTAVGFGTVATLSLDLLYNSSFCLPDFPLSPRVSVKRLARVSLYVQRC
jgi:hypothetical protein